MTTRIKLLVIFIFTSLCFPLFYQSIKVCNNNLPYISSSVDGIKYSLDRPSWANKNTVKEKIDTLFDNNEYTIIEMSLPEGINGEAKTYTNTILISDKLSLDMYVYTLTHELTHINYKVRNERKTNLIAWKLLYFSEIDYFKNIALAYADSDAKGRVPYEYSILGYIEHYLI